MIHRCASCGFRSDVSTFFRRERGGFLNAWWTACAACLPYIPTRRERRSVRAAFATPIICAIPLIARSFLDQRTDIYLLSLLLGLTLSYPLRIAIHEFGHALAAWLAGLKVNSISVGTGPPLLFARCQGVRIEVRRYLCAGGLTRFRSRTGRRIRWRSAIAILGGPVSNLVTGALGLAFCALLDDDQITTVIAVGALAGFALGNLFTGVFNLISMKRGDAESVGSDGRQLIGLLRSPTQQSGEEPLVPTGAQVTLERDFSAAGEEALRGLKADPLDMSLLSYALHCVSRAEGDQTAMDCFDRHRDILARAEAAAPERPAVSAGLPWVYTNVAWSALKSGAAERMAQAEDYSERALAALPENPESQGTRGAVRIAQGDVVCGMPLLLGAARHISDPIDKADFCTYLAEGERRAGDSSKAAAFEALRRYILATA